MKVHSADRVMCAVNQSMFVFAVPNPVSRLAAGDGDGPARSAAICRNRTQRDVGRRDRHAWHAEAGLWLGLQSLPHLRSRLASPSLSRRQSSTCAVIASVLRFFHRLPRRFEQFAYDVCGGGVFLVQDFLWRSRISELSECLPAVGGRSRWMLHGDWAGLAGARKKSSGSPSSRP